MTQFPHAVLIIDVLSAAFPSALRLGLHPLKLERVRFETISGISLLLVDVYENGGLRVAWNKILMSRTNTHGLGVDRWQDHGAMGWNHWR